MNTQKKILSIYSFFALVFLPVISFAGMQVQSGLVRPSQVVTPKVSVPQVVVPTTPKVNVPKVAVPTPRINVPKVAVPTPRINVPKVVTPINPVRVNKIATPRNALRENLPINPKIKDDIIIKTRVNEGLISVRPNNNDNVPSFEDLAKQISKAINIEDVTQADSIDIDKKGNIYLAFGDPTRVGGPADPRNKNITPGDPTRSQPVDPRNKFVTPGDPTRSQPIDPRNKNITPGDPTRSQPVDPRNKFVTPGDPTKSTPIDPRNKNITPGDPTRSQPVDPRDKDITLGDPTRSQPIDPRNKNITPGDPTRSQPIDPRNKNITPGDPTRSQPIDPRNKFVTPGEPTPSEPIDPIKKGRTPFGPVTPIDPEKRNPDAPTFLSFFDQLFDEISVYYEVLSKSQFSNTPVSQLGVYAYHPLTSVDLEAFDDIDVDPDAYEFIENNISLKDDINTYFGIN